MKVNSLLQVAFLRTYAVVMAMFVVLPAVQSYAESFRLPAAGSSSENRAPASIQSVVTEAEGNACMGDDKSRKQTESAAMQDAKRRAGESASTYIQSETSLKDGMLESDLVSAYTNAKVRVIQELAKEWFKDPGLGECHRVRIKAEVTPNEKAMVTVSAQGREALAGDPKAPLSVRVWTDRPRYTEGERMRLYLKGNKPFYGRVVYRQADGTLVQLLPNPYRQSNHFEGGIVYELPSAEDRFSMDTTAPFGSERVTVYACTAPGGDPEVEPADNVYRIRTTAADMSVATRGIRLVKSDRAKSLAAEFFESSVDVQTWAK
ncbi:DUF4384 domain-containing protein [Geomesophilobacter sediminis]|uniref:DUF4384 domain-containing protein n=1 Tax=Geomesophilobacter sediminis TaxID=2798584 RepID=A0A8J7M2P5_9BACT|nr:DUF4384 domain-containing protein [Geomesophilobacter sediminis]MBJ6727580.1 DUF4384 domain-containing protein [Geomesophilobacter sediminis]